MPASEAIQARYGRRAGWLRHHLARTLDRFGVFAPLRQIAWGEVERLVFVCQGNICRSAYADARARAAGLRSVSFGLGARDGDCANALASERAAARGVDLSAHRATSASAFRIAPGDLLLTMEPAQLPALAKLGAQATLLGLWATPPRPHLEDPYGLCAAYFDTCFEVIDSAVERIVRIAPRAAIAESRLNSRRESSAR